jgi:hypothetical protein
VFSVVTRFTCMSVLHDIDTNKLSLVRIRSFLKPSIPRYVSYVMIVDRYLSISHTSQFTEIYDAGCCLVVMNLSQLRGRFFFFALGGFWEDRLQEFVEMVFMDGETSRIFSNLILLRQWLMDRIVSFIFVPCYLSLLDCSIC